MSNLKIQYITQLKVQYLLVSLLYLVEENNNNYTNINKLREKLEVCYHQEHARNNKNLTM